MYIIFQRPEVVVCTLTDTETEHELILCVPDLHFFTGTWDFFDFRDHMTFNYLVEGVRIMKPSLCSTYK